MASRVQSDDTPSTWSAKGQNSTVSFDGSTIVITRSWNAPGGKGETTYLLRQITGMDLTLPGLGSMAGRFTLVVVGGAVQQRRGQGSAAARTDPLTVPFTYSHRSEFEALAAAVRAALAEFYPATGGPVPGGLAEHLALLAGLHAQGQLTDKEFRAAKARLLGGA